MTSEKVTKGVSILGKDSFVPSEKSRDPQRPGETGTDLFVRPFSSLLLFVYQSYGNRRLFFSPTYSSLQVTFV